MAVFALLVVSFWIGTLLDVVRRADWQVRTLRRSAWIPIVAAIPVIGAVLWLALGRPWGPIPLPEQRVHPAVHFALERERAAARDAEAEFRRRCSERAAEQREAARMQQLYLSIREPEGDSV
ncbi:hypothetical protein GCM10023094_46630 [Rhodococcus olei]|uniref:Cardiolipin synthase N-terminal domain-containing protein n=1 Tax=Rhodococcus olei TaxID=2161675 RepID=A0ABP8PJI0_9NOCA